MWVYYIPNVGWTLAMYLSSPPDGPPSGPTPQTITAPKSTYERQRTGVNKRESRLTDIMECGKGLPFGRTNEA